MHAGTVLEQIGREREAVALFEAALKINPDLADAQLELGNAYQETAVASGSKIKLGQNQAMVRITHIAKSKTAAEESVMRCDSDIFRNFYTALAGRKLAPAEVLGAVSESENQHLAV